MGVPTSVVHEPGPKPMTPATPPVVSVGEADRRLRACDVLSIAYLVITSPLLFLHPVDRVLGVVLGFLHLFGAVLLAGARMGGLHRHRVGRLILDFYPLALFPALYSEVGFVNRVFHRDVFFDQQIQSLEQAVFHFQPARDLHLRFPSRVLGEYLHLGYLSYYLLAPTLACFLWFRRPAYAYERAVATIALAFYICFIIFILYPVAGPYYNFTPPDANAVGYVLPHLVRWLLDRGSAVGSAFPSSHVAVATTVWIMAMRYYRKLAVAYVFFIPALAVGAVYLGFHYAIDVTAGALVGIFMGTVGHRLVDRLAWTLQESRHRTGPPGF